MEREAIVVFVSPPTKSLPHPILPTGVPTVTPYVPAQPAEEVPPPITPTPTPAVTAGIPELTRSLYILTSQRPESSIIGDDHGLWVLEPGSPTLVRATPPDQHVTAVDIQPSNGRIAYGTGKGQIFILAPNGQAQIIHSSAAENAEKPAIGSLSWSPNGELLAFTAAYRDNDLVSVSGGLWLLGLADEAALHLLSNRHIQPGDTDVSAYKAIIDVDFSPDGSALLLQGSFWEYADTLWMSPLGVDAGEANIHNPDGHYRDGS